MKDKVSVTIPRALAVLLSSEADDYKDATKYAETQEVARALLRLLLTRGRVSE